MRTITPRTSKPRLDFSPAVPGQSVLPVDDPVFSLNPRDSGFYEITGSRAALSAEGVIPAGTLWPQGKSVTRWKAGRFAYDLSRLSGKGATADAWRLRSSLADFKDVVALDIVRKTQDLRDAIYRQSPAAGAAFRESWARYEAAARDDRFQAFKALVVGSPPSRRGRKFNLIEGEIA